MLLKVAPLLILASWTAHSAVVFSKYLNHNISISEKVPSINQAETIVLPYMKSLVGKFKGKKILDIGTGSGIIGLYALKLGASEVIGTDIDPRSVSDFKLNAKSMGFQRNVKSLLVKKIEGPYDQFSETEKFDFIISNPPYTLDVDAQGDDDFVDSSFLGIKIIKGLNERLIPGGTAILLYRDVFYHELIVKLARKSGFKVTSFATDRVTPRQMAALYNAYIEKIADKAQLKKEDFHFDPHKDEWAKLKQKIVSDEGQSPYPGLIVIEKGNSL